jgi:glycosyltransferase involved in cell wall biosynthesis
MGDERLELFADLASNLPQKSLQPLVSKLPLTQCEVCVIVPVRNEAETLEATLNALNYQIDLEGKRLDLQRYEVILLANNCSDNSAEVARNFARLHPQLVLHVAELTLPPAEAYIGRVRQILMDEAHRRLIYIGRKHGIIASTDGDSQVTPTWIAANLAEIEAGADAVGGRIYTTKSDRATLNPYAKACYLREVGYRSLIAELEAYIDPDPYDYFPRHYQHYGASLAVTAQMYKQAGGLPAVRTPEDVAFYQALLRVNARFRHSPLVKVVTSARQTGRAALGLSNQLNQWTAMGIDEQPFLVEPIKAIALRLQVRHQLRLLWSGILNGYQPNTTQIAQIADDLGITAQWLAKELMQPCTFNLLFEKIEQRQEQEGIWAQRWQKVEIREAIAQLRLDLNRLRKKCDRTYAIKLPSSSRQEFTNLRTQVLIPS